MVCDNVHIFLSLHPVHNADVAHVIAHVSHASCAPKQCLRLHEGGRASAYYMTRVAGQVHLVEVHRNRTGRTLLVPVAPRVQVAHIPRLMLTVHYMGAPMQLLMVVVGAVRAQHILCSWVHNLLPAILNMLCHADRIRLPLLPRRLRNFHARLFAFSAAARRD